MDDSDEQINSNVATRRGMRTGSMMDTMNISRAKSKKKLRMMSTIEEIGKVVDDINLDK